MIINGKGLSIGDKVVYSNYLNNASIGIIGYQDLCRMRRKLSPPEEIMIGGSNKGAGYILHLTWQRKDSFYTPSMYTEVPASVRGFLPVSGDFDDYNWPPMLVNKSALVVGASTKDFGLWLFNFANRFTPKRLVGSKDLMSYMKKGIFPHLSFEVDHDNRLISLLMHENLGPKQTMPRVEKDGAIVNQKPFLGRIDLTDILIQIGTDFDKTFATSLRFITQSK